MAVSEKRLSRRQAGASPEVKETPKQLSSLHRRDRECNRGDWNMFPKGKRSHNSTTKVEGIDFLSPTVAKAAKKLHVSPGSSAERPKMRVLRKNPFLSQNTTQFNSAPIAANRKNKRCIVEQESLSALIGKNTVCGDCNKKAKVELTFAHCGVVTIPKIRCTNPHCNNQDVADVAKTNVERAQTNAHQGTSNLI
ncbi:hypothetical protein SEMRO_1857_G302020.1 [Seminavis robusta]|uniref:Uncharacterized protein n=1 Tax=Seminavis robusta TaxID=568900 RepID=A0A9N8EUI3_9STRA|nr:hypothetical protein SEMRO_1857_G302020.1 [Seminavis robusta]|eukprot:Sro1857_g302020.1 n/a (194) ;mRNA; r:650-1231